MPITGFHIAGGIAGGILSLAAFNSAFESLGRLGGNIKRAGKAAFNFVKNRKPAFIGKVGAKIKNFFGNLKLRFMLRGQRPVRKLPAGIFKSKFQTDIERVRRQFEAAAPS